MNIHRIQTMLARAVSAILVFLTIPVVVSAQTYFITTVRGETSAVCDESRGDFQTLTRVRSPTGNAQGQQALLKLVTASSGVVYQVARASTETATATPGGLAASIFDAVSTRSVASVLVRSLIEPVATGGQLVLDRVVYENFDLGAGETFALKVCEDVVDREYFGFQGRSEEEVTREKMQASDVLDFGEVEVGVSEDAAPVRAVEIRNVGTAPLIIDQGPITNDPPPAFFAKPLFAPGTTNPGEQADNDLSNSSGVWIKAAPSAAGSRTATLNVDLRP